MLGLFLWLGHNSGVASVDAFNLFDVAQFYNGEFYDQHWPGQCRMHVLPCQCLDVLLQSGIHGLLLPAALFVRQRPNLPACLQSLLGIVKRPSAIRTRIIPLDAASIMSFKSAMLNRANLKTVAFTSIGCAAVIWLAGHILFSRVSRPELNACAQFNALQAYHQTNEAAIERQRLASLATSNLTNAGNSFEDSRLYRSIIREADDADREDLKAEEVYLNQAEAIGAVRRAKQLRFTETALGLLAFSSLCGLVLFLTAPPRTS